MAGGFGSLQETYAATVEAFEGYLGHLESRRPIGGRYATFEVPPRSALKLFATALVSLWKT